MERQLRRQTAEQDAAATGSGRTLRLDPDRLPHRFTVKGDPLGTGGDDTPFDVYLDEQTVVMKRRLGGLPLTVVAPIRTFGGLYARVKPGGAPGTLIIDIGLYHRDPALCVELLSTDGVETAAEDWRDWSRVLDLPLIAIDADGSIRRLDERPDAAKGALRPGSIQPSRRRIAALTNRRPRFLLRRKVGRKAESLTVYHGERELIARR